MEQITNGKLTNIEMEMAIDELKRNLPYFIQSTAVTAKVLKAKYDSLVSEGFTEQQAIEIIKVRPLYE
ncbi:hypothetical protein P9D39_03645 [Heyndrickxia oleronia]|uniref:Phage protein n=1 Tax=Heyndrickxia oleronia TaxID=38875 RepID=A0A8E2IA42_9BACI|nr:hypothetical protein [Heyndrickxia oleronia]MEC1373405.1 hypothetical protein [Heyndrickxia oleronia]NYV63804.1 hypothetical protein [Bacillus sp. Gen3]OOP69546.1 hypothetical protein BWZ43_04715 [Heyndrickxia oleronia]QQZ04299.1 hypothetical protein I5818_21895 [Heyndrickxia oleronia]